MQEQFPRTNIGGVSVSRLIIGTNWILGYSHTSPAADRQICRRHSDEDYTAAMLENYLYYGCDTILGPFGNNSDRTNALLRAVKKAEDKTGRHMILIDTPILNMDNNESARREAESVIRTSASLGATFCFPHHSSAEQLVCKNTQTIDRLPDYLSMIRDAGMIPGLSAHMPELVVYSDLNQYDVETYIQIYNCAGFMMQIEIEYSHKIIWNAKKPVITIKPMAAGRVSPFVGLTFSWSTIRERDCVCVGACEPDEALEDIEISFAALQRRAPNLEGRNSPSKTSIMK